MATKDPSHDLTGVHRGVGTADLVSKIESAADGDVITITYTKGTDGEGRKLETTGTMHKRDTGIDSAADFDITTGNGEAYLHVNTDTGAYAFFDESRELSERYIISVKIH